MPEVLGQYEAFYTVATDVSSLLSALSSALRLPIYIANDKLIRLEVLLAAFFFECFSKKQLYFRFCEKFENFIMAVSVVHQNKMQNGRPLSQKNADLFMSKSNRLRRHPQP